MTPRSMSEFDPLDPHENPQPDNGIDHFQGYGSNIHQGSTYSVQPGTMGEVSPSYSPSPQIQIHHPMWRPKSPSDFVDIQIETPEDQTYANPSASTSYSVATWTGSSSSDSAGIAGPSNYYSLPSYPAQVSQLFTQFPTVEPPGSPSSMLPSPCVPSTTPTSFYSVSPSPSLLSFPPQDQGTSQYSYRDQIQFFRDALDLPMSSGVGDFVPQQMYRPHTNSDRRRYVEEVHLEQPIYFWMENPVECGIPLIDALQSRVRRLQNRDETVFAGRGPSISVRIQWPGYRQWSRQIPTKDFRSPPGPITRAKLAKNVAKCVQRFIDAKKNNLLEDDTDVKWKVGTRQNEIKLDDLLLVSMHHVSMGSWQPQLRLRRPFSS